MHAILLQRIPQTIFKQYYNSYIKLNGKLSRSPQQALCLLQVYGTEFIGYLRLILPAKRVKQ